MENEYTARIALLGGDLRLKFAAESLVAKGYKVVVWNIPEIESEKGISVCKDIKDAIDEVDAVILPLPSSTDGVTLNGSTQPNCSSVKLDEIIRAMNKKAVLIGGRMPQETVKKAEEYGIRVFDYFSDECLQIKNAYTTAEAALSIAMERLNVNVSEARLAVTGYGRIAKQLARLLRKLGARVTVAARKSSDLVWASLEGCDTVSLAEGDGVTVLAKGYDIIFNTIPQIVFHSEFIRILDRHTLIIELASSPGGIDIQAAKENKKKVLWGASLPGKYAPKSAGAHIADSISAILEKEVPL